MEDVSAVTIKGEGGDEQESEDVREHLTKTENHASKSAKDDSTDVKLASMRCQDCGQQFTRWEAFKTHLRKHVLEEAMAEEEEQRQSIKRSLEMNGSNGNVESAAPEKKQKNDDHGDYKENSDVDVEGDEEYEEFFDSSWQVRPSEIVTVRPRVAMLSEEEKPVFSSSHRVYACSICGKVYSYLESFRNHQKTHEKEEKQPTENKCPDCGKVFARPSLLVTHLKVHRPPVPMEPSTLKCDQCVKNFNSLQTYLIHMDLHKQKPFWCLACAKGFRDELSLDKHLQGHNLRRHKCDLCEKSFCVPAELRYHYNTHTGAKPYKCTLCKKNFSQLGNLITHRKKHVGVYVGASKTPLGPRNHLFAGRRRVTEMKRLVFTGMGSTDEAEVIDMLQEHQNEEEEEEEEEEEDIVTCEEESVSEESGSESSSEDSGAEESSSGSGLSKSDSSDSSGSDSSDDSDSSGSGVEEEEQEGKEETVLEAHVAVQQKRPKEWECFECGEGFDQESALHLHYMKHASGELPVQ
ncbi:zinc finger and SCAN domain-containing protein 2 isoform X2 [Oncorhynchus tshawytscha]|uniref:C2H2-type domain-containing protein n=1 Tax=Oncorhynchus tshawytscha TaxID=74940 RepID=A0A8C8IG56_ONCTS|nr:zinc finger and SCAN domain-containing protein 2 isoform X2 [Oncorhynchus tshawytscha]